ncbi:PREDICTED: putative nuclease HARBI1 [Papilio polytes]|uniref:putative nuclease HARBI1 n=1 Tax=Papilio polytes TaxID=76194 RepID=UPI000676261A|nr:PREDICTED: putative nuclease HARBI1 [Papilio polytes]
MDSADEEELLFLNASIAFIQQRRKPRLWVRNFFKKRETHGVCSSLYNDLVIHDAVGFKNTLRMSPEDLEILLQKVSPKITKHDTNFRQAISPKDQLLVTLRYLATGDTYTALMLISRISKTKISVFVPEVCKAIVQVLADYVKMPTTADGWEEVAQNFKIKWNLPHCIGHLDGRHIEMIRPKNGNDYINYRKNYSIVLLGLVDANYNFLYVDVGTPGKISDSEVFNNSNLCRSLQNLPQPKPLPGRTQPSPYVIIADDAFALSKHLLKPYSYYQVNGHAEKMFNYRLNRSRVVVENAFGILSARFKVLRQSILVSPTKASTIVLACVYLHNFLRKSERSVYLYTPPGSLDEMNPVSGEISLGTWRDKNQGMILLQMGPSLDCPEGVAVREEFKAFFMT